MKDMKQPARLRLEAPSPKTAAAEKSFNPTIQNKPSLPPINWSSIGAQPPQPLITPANSLPQSSIVILTWADAEWAAMEHVFCNSATAMTYSARNDSSWAGWQKYDKNLPTVAASLKWTYWGWYRQVQLGSTKVLLFKSNTHLDWPGDQYLESLINTLIDDVKPKLIMSIGTAGGAQVADHVGTVNVVRAGTLYEKAQPQSAWPDYSNTWSPNWSILKKAAFNSLLFPIPTLQSDLQSLCSQFNTHYKYTYTLNDLNPGNLNMGDPTPKLNNMTAAGTPLLSTDSFVVANTAGNLKTFACVEMDDAIIAKVCAGRNTPFGFVRNISDPAQSASLPAEAQAHWGQTIYDCYGFYTSYNGALAAWAMIN
jgi:hypothetical protein